MCSHRFDVSTTSYLDSNFHQDISLNQEKLKGVLVPSGFARNHSITVDCIVLLTAVSSSAQSQDTKTLIQKISYKEEKEVSKDLEGSFALRHATALYVVGRCNNNAWHKGEKEFPKGAMTADHKD